MQSGLMCVLVALLMVGRVASWKIPEDLTLSAGDEPDEAVHDLQTVTAQVCNFGTLNPRAGSCNGGCDWGHNTHCDNCCNTNCDYTGLYCNGGCTCSCNGNPTTSCDDNCDSGCTPTSFSQDISMSLSCPLNDPRVRRRRRGSSAPPPPPSPRSTTVLTQAMGENSSVTNNTVRLASGEAHHINTSHDWGVMALTKDTPMSHEQHMVLHAQKRHASQSISAVTEQHLLTYERGQATMPPSLRFHGNDSVVRAAQATCGITVTLQATGVATISGQLSSSLAPARANLDFPVEMGVRVDAQCAYGFSYGRSIDKSMGPPMTGGQGAQLELSAGFELSFNYGVEGYVRPYVVGRIQAQVDGSGPSGSASFEPLRAEYGLSMPSMSVSGRIFAAATGKIGLDTPIGSVTIASIGAEAALEVGGSSGISFLTHMTGTPSFALGATVDVMGQLGFSASLGYPATLCGESTEFSVDVPLTCAVSNTNGDCTRRILTATLFEAGPQYHFAPAGYTQCDSGDPVGRDDCLNAVSALTHAAGIQRGRTNMPVGAGGRCNDGGWGSVPLGCSSQTGGDHAAHWKSGGINCNGHRVYSLVCTGA